MIRDLEVEDYALVVADWHAFDRSLWEQIVEFLRGLTSCVGISSLRMDTQLFTGTYAVTPFGAFLARLVRREDTFASWRNGL
jgi:hypothetical protein